MWIFDLANFIRSKSDDVKLFSPYIILLASFWWDRHKIEKVNKPVLSLGSYEGCFDNKDSGKYLGTTVEFDDDMRKKSNIKLKLFNTGGSAIKNVIVGYSFENVRKLVNSVKANGYSDILQSPGFYQTTLDLDSVDKCSGTFGIERNGDPILISTQFSKKMILVEEPVLGNGFSEIIFDKDIELIIHYICSLNFREHIITQGSGGMRYSSNKHHNHDIKILIEITYDDQYDRPHSKKFVKIIHTCFSKRDDKYQSTYQIMGDKISLK